MLCENADLASFTLRIQVLDASTAAVVSEIAAKGILDIAFSPKGTQIQSWERQGA